MLRSWISAVALLGLGCALAGCITVGGPFSPEALELFETNVTTKAQVLERLGEPWRTGEEDGLETWTYGHYRYAVARASRTRDLVLRFDDRGVVVSYTYNVTSPSP